MTKYLREYMNYVREQLISCEDTAGLEEILAEHKDKISFMQHERLVHFLVTMMFALILVMFIIAQLMTENIMLTVLIIMIIALLAAYIKHYYFLENTVQQMYKIYDEIIVKRKNIAEKIHN